MIKTVKDTVVNRYGLLFEVELGWSDEMNDYLIDLPNTAKMILYSDLKELLPPDIERRRIQEILSMGLNGFSNILNKCGGQA